MDSHIASGKRKGSEVLETVRVPEHGGGTAKRFLLYCGILSSVWYTLMNIIVPVYFPGYKVVSQVISELSAVDAPSRTLWTLLGVPYTLLIIAFGLGVWQVAGTNHRLRIAGSLLVAYGALGVLWPFAPMHLRETLAAGAGNWSDTMHIALGVVTQILYFLTLGFAAAALGRPFRLYSIITFATLLVFGVLTFLEAPGIAANRPTPLIGLWERINIAVFLLWIVVLAFLLLRREKHAPARSAAAPA